MLHHVDKGFGQADSRQTTSRLLTDETTYHCANVEDARVE